MPDQQSYKIGDKLIFHDLADVPEGSWVVRETMLKIGDKLIFHDLADVPEGSWVVRETMLFVRAQAGHSIVSCTPISRASLSGNKIPDRFTLVYSGNYNVEKSAAIADALNSL